MGTQNFVFNAEKETGYSNATQVIVLICICIQVKLRLWPQFNDVASSVRCGIVF